MIDQAVAPAPAPVRRRRLSRRAWIILALTVILVAGGVIAAVSVSFHYLHAPALVTDGGGWIPPDNAHVHNVDAGPYSASIVAPRQGHAQTFELDLVNPSSVSQTVLGLTDGKYFGNPKLVAEPEYLMVSAGPIFPQPAVTHYTSKPVTIPPNGEYSLRITQDTDHNWQPCRSEFWTDVSLQVRVGVFTRTEDLDLDRLIMEIQEPGHGC